MPGGGALRAAQPVTRSHALCLPTLHRAPASFMRAPTPSPAHLPLPRFRPVRSLACIYCIATSYALYILCILPVHIIYPPHARLHGRRALLDAPCAGACFLCTYFPAWRRHARTAPCTLPLAAHSPGIPSPHSAHFLLCFALLLLSHVHCAPLALARCIIAHPAACSCKIP